MNPLSLVMLVESIRRVSAAGDTATTEILIYSVAPSASPSSPLVGKLNSLVSSSPASHEATKAARLSSVRSPSSDHDDGRGSSDFERKPHARSTTAQQKQKDGGGGGQRMRTVRFAGGFEVHLRCTNHRVY